MNKIFICLSIILSSSVSAQKVKCLTEFNINIGKILTAFSYDDTNGDTNDDMRYRSGTTYSLNFGFKIGDKHTLRPELIYQEFGANSIYNGSSMEWILNYLGVGLGYSYTAFNTDGFSISPSIFIHTNYLYRGSQIIGEYHYDIRKQNLFKPLDLTTSLGLDSRFKATDKLYINLNYRYVIGLLNIENSIGEEKTKNKGHIASIGLSFNL